VLTAKIAASLPKSPRSSQRAGVRSRITSSEIKSSGTGERSPTCVKKTNWRTVNCLAADDESGACAAIGPDAASAYALRRARETADFSIRQYARATVWFRRSYEPPGVLLACFIIRHSCYVDLPLAVDLPNA
jgi:hypothetical protein